MNLEKMGFYGQEVCANGDKGIVQMCRYCHGDKFVVIVMERDGVVHTQLMCPECDEPHVVISITNPTVSSVKSLAKEVTCREEIPRKDI